MSFAPIYPLAQYEWLPANKHGGGLSVTHGLVLHVNAGNGDPYNWWTNPAAPTASSHFQAMKDGRILQYVRTDTVAYAQVAGNYSWHSVESEGFPNELLNSAQLNSLAKLYRWGHDNLGWAYQVTNDVNGYGFGIHSMGGANWGGHACPGDLRANQRQQILSMAQGTPPVASNRYAGEPTIAEGANDANYPWGVHPVKDLQAGLNAASNRGLGVDGVFGATTEKAVKDFQTYFKLKVDGTVGSQTWLALNYVLISQGK